MLTWTYLRLPEPKGRTYAELDVLFAHKISARKFPETRVDQFCGNCTKIFERSDTSSDESEKKRYFHVEV